jgi:hypothetical protein
MEHLNGLQHSERPHINQFTLVKPRTHERTAAYLAALELVQYIDESLSKGSQHYRTKSGQLLRTLDEVVHAILADNLVWETESASWDQRSARAA